MIRMGVGELERKGLIEIAVSTIHVKPQLFLSLLKIFIQRNSRSLKRCFSGLI